MMQARSSIFSSEKQLFANPFIWSVFFIVLLIGGDWLLRQTQWYQFRFGNRLGNAIKVLQKQTSTPAAAPVIVFTGTSKMHSAIDPATIEKIFPGKRCINLSLNSMTFWEILKVLQYSRLNGEKTELLVCEIAPFMFNANCLNPATRRQLDNELQLDIWGNKDDILNQDSFKKSYSLIKKKICGPLRLEDVFTALRNNVPDVLPPPVYHTDLELEKRLAKRQAFSPAAAATAHSNNFTFSEYNVYCFNQIVRYCRNNNIKLLLLELPSHPEYTRSLFKNIPEPEQLQYQELLKTAAVPVILMRNLKCYQLDNSVFVDYAHFSAAGKLRFSSVLGKIIYDRSFLSGSH